MPLKILATADVHLGQTFSNYPVEVSQKLAEARFEALERLVVLATNERCDLLVVGGDLFDTTRVPKKTLIRAAKILSGFEGVVLVLPGNHDYVTNQPEEIWSHFIEAKDERVKFLSKGEPLSLVPFGLPVCVYPAPCQSRHSKTHVTGWINGSPRNSEARFHIGLAHGSFEGLTPDLEGDYFPMTRDELLTCNLDLWLMGHIHRQFPVATGSTDKIFYPGTPEPDGFDCRHEGKAWLIELSGDKLVNAVSVSTGQYRFSHEDFEITELEDFKLLEEKYPEGSCGNLLLKLKITGDLPREEFEILSEKLRGFEGRFLYLETDDSEVKIRLTPEEIRKKFPEGSFALQLMSELCRSKDDQDALRVAYELIEEIQEEGNE